MGPLDQINSSLLAQFISFVGMGSFFDNIILKDSVKKSISMYILGDKKTNFSLFEKSVIDAIIEWFIVKGENSHISGQKVFIYSCFYCTLQMIAVISFGMFDKNDDNDITFYAILYLIIFSTGVFLSFTSDFYSIFITKMVFYKRNYSSMSLPFLWILDFFITFLPIIIILLIILAIYNLAPGSQNKKMIDETTPIMLFTIASGVLSSIFIGFIQAIIIIFGTLLRFSVMQMGFINKLFENGKFSENPITLIFLFSGLIIYFSFAVFNLFKDL